MFMALCQLKIKPDFTLTQNIFSDAYRLTPEVTAFSRVRNSGSTNMRSEHAMLGLACAPEHETDLFFQYFRAENTAFIIEHFSSYKCTELEWTWLSRFHLQWGNNYRSRWRSKKGKL